MTKKDLVVRFDGEKTEVKSVAGGGGGGSAAEGGTSASSAGGPVAPAAQPLSPNDNPAYGSPLRAAEVAGSGVGGGGGSDVRGKNGREEAGVFEVREFVYICCARLPKLRQSARRKRQNFTNFNNSKLIFKKTGG